MEWLKEVAHLVVAVEFALTAFTLSQLFKMNRELGEIRSTLSHLRNSE